MQMPLAIYDYFIILHLFLLGGEVSVAFLTVEVTSDRRYGKYRDRTFINGGRDDDRFCDPFNSD